MWKHKVGWRARLFSHTTPFFFLQERNYHVTVGLCLKTQHASRSDFVVTSLPLFSQSATQEENQWEQTKGFVPLGLEIMDLQWDETQKITFWDTTLLDCYKLGLARDQFPVLSNHAQQTTNRFESRPAYRYLSMDEYCDESIHKSNRPWKIR